MNNFRQIINRHRAVWSNKKFVLAAILGFIFIGISLIVNQFAGAYTVRHESNAVTDIILDNTPILNVDFIFSEGSLMLVAFTILLLLYTPKRIPFVAKSVALFIIIRSAFVMLTHIGPSPNRAYIDPTDLIGHFTFGGDLFFSGHTGLPFLMGLILWDNKYLRVLYLASSIIFGTSVLFGHLHYSIDVFAAFFITYTIYHIALKWFQSDYAFVMKPA